MKKHEMIYLRRAGLRNTIMAFLLICSLMGPNRSLVWLVIDAAILVLLIYDFLNFLVVMDNHSMKD